MFRLHSGLCCRRWWSTQYVHFALHLWLLRIPTPPLAALSTQRPLIRAAFLSCGG